MLVSPVDITDDITVEAVGDDFLSVVADFIFQAMRPNILSKNMSFRQDLLIRKINNADHLLMNGDFRLQYVLWQI